MSEEVLEDVRNKLKDIGVNFLENANLLENTTKELITNKLIDKITIGEKQFDEFFREYLKKNQLNKEKQFISFLDKNRIYLCCNCIRYYKHLNGKDFRSQFQNIKSFIKCNLQLKKIELPFYESM